MTEHLNLEKGTRIIIGESLTQVNLKIWVEASRQKRAGKLVQVFTQDGLVHVKAVKTAKAMAIKSQRQLEIFIEKNAMIANLEAQQIQSTTTSSLSKQLEIVSTPSESSMVSHTNKEPPTPMDTTNNAKN